MPVPPKISQLIEKFEAHSADYRASAYNETQLRRDFLDPFFAALGWDMNNEAHTSEDAREVLQEYSIKIEGKNKAPDYCFRSGRTDKFFVEAKKPSVNLKDDAKAAFQTRAYGWNRGLPFCILTDFEEFAVYDCRFKPVLTESAQTARSFYCKYSDYATHWDKIEALFAREAVRKGALEQESAQSVKQGTVPFDADFLKLIEGWRQRLAENIAQRNKARDLSPHDLNYAVQMTIDRILFLRMCEDRDIEEFEQLKKLVGKKGIYTDLIELFRQADNRYNSGLFHFGDDKKRPGASDKLTPQLKIDDAVLEDIFYSLYSPQPYNFRVMSVEILGQVYEQFLGKVIRLEKNQVKVEAKPEVRKAGGVYYTPAYIVDYIVRQTVGKLCAGKTPQQVEAIRVLDPACGSGSFLIGAYNYLLDWHLDWYAQHEPEKLAAKSQPVIFQATNRSAPDAAPLWRLTAREKKRILLSNIYGVDIDRQAVEVTKLSLLLKMLEDESQETLPSAQGRLLASQERLLPDLDHNIKCGNSLIGHDFYDTVERDSLTTDEQDRINTFDWADEFSTIMKAGGFDAVIGNPPYIFTRNQGISSVEKAYFYSHYKYQSAQLNTFGIFTERGYDLMQEGSMMGFIIPNNWLTIESFSLLRQFLLQNARDMQVLNILDQVFTASVDTAIVVLQKGSPTNLIVGEMSNREVFSWCVDTATIKPPSYIIQIGLLRDASSQGVLDRIQNVSQPLFNFCTVSTGLKAYQTGKGKPAQTDKQKKNRVFHSSSKRDTTYGRYLDGVNVSRYHLTWSGEYLSYGDWLAEPRRSVPFTGERLLIRQIPSKPPYLVHGVFTDEPFYNDINSMVVFAPVEHISLKYLSGVINSRLISFWFAKTFDKLQRKIFPQFKVGELATFPIRTIDFSNKADKDQHDNMVKLVERMLELHKQLATARTSQNQTTIQRQIAATDKQIDQLVYELYDLTAEEIALVEAGA